MKKVLTIAIALVAAVTARAASVDWSLDRGSVEGFTEGGLVVAFLNSDRADVTSAISGAGGDTSKMASDLSGFVQSSDHFTKRGAAGGTISDNSIASGTSYDVFFVAFDGATIADSTEVLVGSGTATGKGYEPPSSAEVVANSSSVSGSWATIAVPEPCSVALLALGLAAFGLKRKVA